MISIDKELVKNLIQKNLRLDKRPFSEYRKIKVTTGVVPKAEGSAQVEIGNTKVIAGVKMDIGQPFPDRPESGVFMVNAEFLSLAYKDFESGPPSAEAVELARVVDRAIRESEAIDLKKLCLEPRKKVWMIFIDIDIIDHDGNLTDAASLAAIAALATAKMPKLNVIEESGEKIYEIDWETKTDPLPITKKPVTVTIAKINDIFIVDPTLAEEQAIDVKLSIGLTEEKLCSMQKEGTGGLTEDDLTKMIDIARQKAVELRKFL